ncbi:uncharacterized protein LOC124165532 [Ischnura elegans]|uniref:uncharacterized protein LOC124165532 n=1 Tax=Ischnura elegans TaxID=197161 RepID=UPI001ED8BE8C|nr:uncharacterized protein LOC124165532 [Ischnura elegans]
MPPSISARNPLQLNVCIFAMAVSKLSGMLFVLLAMTASCLADGGTDPMELRMDIGPLSSSSGISTRSLPGEGILVYEYEGHIYRFHHEDRVTWHEAKAICESEGPGSYLAVIEDMEEAQFLSEAMAGSLCNFVSLQSVWVGGHYEKDGWRWDYTGQVIPPKPDSNGYPPWGLFTGIKGRDCLSVERFLWNRPRFQDLKCDRHRSFVCERGCVRLKDTDRGHWEPESCVDEGGEKGDKCRFVCNPEYQLSGSEVIECTGAGWNGTGGFGHLPHCRTPEELGEDFVDKINDTLSNGRPAGLLFLLDESVSVSPAQFDMELTFVKALAAAFPLSVNRSAGVITFSHVADVDIHLGTSDTCEFLNDMNQIVYTKGGTNILNAMNLAINEVQTNAIHNLTLVFLVTDGISTTDPTPAANKLKAAGNIVFTIGVADYQRDQLEPLATLSDDGSPNFFGVTSFDVFNVVANYLNTTYSDNKLNC